MSYLCISGGVVGLPDLRITGDILGMLQIHFKSLRNGVRIKKKNGHI